MTSVVYHAVMPVPGTPSAPYFEGANITEFLERYRDQCEDANLREEEKLRRLPRYCSMIVGQYVKTMPEWQAKDWDGLQKVLLEEYRDQDSFQQMNSRSFLEVLKSRSWTSEDDVRRFIRHYTAISIVLVADGTLDEYTRGLWFLTGLPADVRDKVTRKCKVNIKEPATLKFNTMAKTAIEIINKTNKVPFGHPMRSTHFQFSPSYTPLNHGSYGAFPSSVQATQSSFQKLVAERPDTFIIRDLPPLIDKSRSTIAPLLGVEIDEVVFVPNATTGVNVVLRNLKWTKGDVIVFFSTVYPACAKTASSVGEDLPLKSVCIQLDYPVEDAQIIAKFKACIERVRAEGKNVRIAMFDTVSSFPAARVPWEDLVGACKELGVLSLVDGAHGVGSLDLTHLASVGPDFFVSNCHKWLYTPRGCAVFYVPYRNQHLIRTSIPTGWGFQDLAELPPLSGKSRFVHLFEFVATIDYTPYICVPAALEFRKTVCGGEAAIRNYCFEIAREGGKRVAEILGTEVMDNKTKTMSQCCLANVALPILFSAPGMEIEGAIDIIEGPKVARWINDTAVKEFDTYLQVAYYSTRIWVRLSGQIYLQLENFEWVGHKLRELCERAENGEFRDERPYEV